MKNLSGKTLIFYTFQNRKSSQFYVTSFKKSMPQQPKIRDVLFELPLDFTTKSYHFRFKSEFSQGDEKIIGWIDISNLLSKVPMVNSNIYIKILQIPSQNYNKLFNRDKLKNIGLLDPSGSEIKANSKYKHPQVETKQKIVQKQKEKQIKIQEKNLFEFDSDITSHNTTTSNEKTEKKNNQKKQLFPEESAQQKLKTFQQGFAQQQKSKQDERQASIILDEKITQWGYCGTKTLNNLTTLLATLHTMWPQWKPVSLSDMLKQEDVEAKFKSAKFMLHPDKNRKKDSQTKYLAKRLFELLNDAKNNQK